MGTEDNIHAKRLIQLFKRSHPEKSARLGSRRQASNKDGGHRRMLVLHIPMKSTAHAQTRKIGFEMQIDVRTGTCACTL